jgi:hypothetical protein
MKDKQYFIIEMKMMSDCGESVSMMLNADNLTSRLMLPKIAEDRQNLMNEFFSKVRKGNLKRLGFLSSSPQMWSHNRNSLKKLISIIEFLEQCKIYVSIVSIISSNKQNLQELGFYHDVRLSAFNTALYSWQKSAFLHDRLQIVTSNFLHYLKVELTKLERVNRKQQPASTKILDLIKDSLELLEEAQNSFDLHDIDEA